MNPVRELSTGGTGNKSMENKKNETKNKRTQSFIYCYEYNREKNLYRTPAIMKFV